MSSPSTLNRQRRIRKREPDSRAWRPTLLIFVGAATLLQMVQGAASFSSCDMVLLLPSIDSADDNPNAHQHQEFHHQRRRRRRNRERRGLQNGEDGDEDAKEEERGREDDWDDLPSSANPDVSFPKVQAAREATNLAYITSALLAIDHLKSGDGSIVPEIAQQSACTSRLPFSAENLFLVRDSDTDDGIKRTLLMDELWSRLHSATRPRESGTIARDENVNVDDESLPDSPPFGDENTTCTTEPQRPPTCAVIGPVIRDSTARTKNSLLEDVVGYMTSSRAPHVSAGSTATSHSTSLTTFQNKAHISTLTEVVVEYLLQAPSQRKHTSQRTISSDIPCRYIGALYQDYNDYGLTFHKHMLEQQEDRKKTLDIRFERLTHPQRSSSADQIRDSLLSLRDLGYRTVVVALEDGLLDRALLALLVRYSHELGMVGNDYLWVLVADGPPPREDFFLRNLIPEEASVWKEFFRASVVLRMLDGYSDEEITDPFVTKWQEQQNSTLIDRVKTAVRRSGGFDSVEKESVGSISGTIRKDSALAEDSDEMAAVEKVFNNLVVSAPPDRAAFVYDSIVAVGLAACKLLPSTDMDASKALSDIFGIDKLNNYSTDESNIFEEQNGSGAGNQENSRTEDDPLLNTGASLTEAVKNVTFRGASGEVGFRGPGNCRTKDGLRFGIFRVVETDESSASTATRARHEDRDCLQLVLTLVRTDERGWRTVGTSAATSGVHQPLMMSRGVANHHSLSPYVRVSALALMISVLIVCAAAIRWIWRMRRTALLNTSEPKLLGIMCVGGAITASSILTLTLADADKLSSSQRSRACMATPWLFIAGMLIIYASVFVRLWKASGAQKEQRNKISGMHWSFVAVVTIVLLSLTLWTTLEPLEWNIFVVKEFPLETVGQCRSNGSLFFYPIAFLLIVAVLSIAFAAWVVREIPGESYDCGWILYACLTQLQCWAVGLPFLFIINSGGLTNASYFGCVICIWCFAISPQVVMLWPKMVAASWRRVRCSSTAGPDCKGKMMLSAAAASVTAGAPVSSSSDAEATPPLSTGGTARYGGRRPSISSASEGVQSSSALGESPFNKNMEIGGEDEEDVSVSVTNGARSAYDEEEANTVVTGGGRSTGLYPGDQSIMSHETTYSESERISMAISLQQRRAMAGITANHVDYRLVALEAHKRVLMLEKQLSSLGQRVETTDRLDVGELGREFRTRRR